MKTSLVVGYANAIGLSIATELAKREDSEKIYINDKSMVKPENNNPKFESIQFDLTQEDYTIFDKYNDKFWDVDTLMESDMQFAENCGIRGVMIISE